MPKICGIDIKGQVRWFILSARKIPLTLCDYGQERFNT